MKVCFITCHYPPLSRTYRRYQFARYLADGGCDVEVVAHGNVSRALGAFVDDPDTVADDADIPVHRPRAIPWYLAGEVLYRLGAIACPHVNWLRPAVRSARAIARSSDDVVVGIYPPLTDLMAAWRTAQQTGARLVLDYRDEYVGLTDGVRSSSARRWQNRLMLAADLVSVATPALARNFMERDGVPEEKLHVTQNGYFVDPGPQAEDYTPRDRLRLVYVGAISTAQGVEVLSGALGRLRRDHPDLAERVEAVIYGPDNAHCRRALSPALVPGVTYGGYLNAGQVSAELLGADACFLSLASADFSYAIPGKLYEYIAHARPILASLPRGAARELIEGEGFGLVAECGSPEDLAAQLVTLLDPAQRQTFHRSLLAKRQNYAAAPNFLSLAQRILEL